MCGRFLLTTEFETIIQRFGIVNADSTMMRTGEIYPSNEVPVVFGNGEKRLKVMKWGFTPSFTKKLLINARSETADIKPTFKNSFLNKRCLIPANAFFEWEKANNMSIKRKVYLEEEDLFAMAAIYNSFKNDDGQSYDAFTILTTAANGKMEKIHDRMPVILQKERETLWLDDSIKDIRVLKSLLVPYNGSMIIN
jgi:putative SOS response-associated peptidase YedK